MNSKNFDRNSKPIRFKRIKDRENIVPEFSKLRSLLEGPLDAKTRTKIINVLKKVMKAIESGKMK
jgi:hypothetical protein